MQPLSFPKLCDSIGLCRIVTHLPWAREDDGRIYKTPWKESGEKKPLVLRCSTSSSLLSLQATKPHFLCCQQAVEGRLALSLIIIWHVDVILRKKEKWQRGIFSSSAADWLHTFFWKERCPLTVTSLVSLLKTDMNPLDSHSHCLVLYSVLTSTYMFYWLNRGLIPVRQNCPNLYQQFGFRKSLTQHPVGLSLLL